MENNIQAVQKLKEYKGISNVEFNTESGIL